MSHKWPDDEWDPEAYAEEQARRMRAARRRDEAYARSWGKVWDAERARPIGQRRYFSIAEIAERLARDPHSLASDPELRERIAGDLAEWVRNRQFAAGEVAVLNGHPPDFRAFELTPGMILVPAAELLFLSRRGLRRYAEASELPGAVSLRHDWLGAETGADAPESAQSTAVTTGEKAAIDTTPGVEKIAEWIFHRRPQPCSYAKLLEAAVSELGTFTEVLFRAAYQKVYKTAPHRPPKTGWPLQHAYESRKKEKA